MLNDSRKVLLTTTLCFILSTACTPTLDQVNRMVNRVPYVANSNFSTAEDFYRHGGDCDGYAFTKRAELRKAGYKNLGDLVIVRLDKELHMVLIVGDIVLDNRYKKTYHVDKLYERYEKI